MEASWLWGELEGKGQRKRLARGCDAYNKKAAHTRTCMHTHTDFALPLYHRDGGVVSTVELAARLARPAVTDTAPRLTTTGQPGGLPVVG